MDKLKPCPFCGNEPTLYQDEMTGHWAVRCVKDNHRPTLINSHGATAWCYSCTDPAEAIAAWNTRADDQSQAAAYWRRMYEETVSDEIVRCRDCKHLDDSEYRRWANSLAECYGEPPLFCDLLSLNEWRMDGNRRVAETTFAEVEPDGFCKWGERKEANYERQDD